MKTASIQALVLLLAMTSGAHAAEPVMPPAKGAKYVALGSSFAAGPGIAAQLGSCGRSDHNYPHLVAAKLGLALADVSCSGATTAHILDTPQNGAAPQLAAVTADTALVTVTIGGNDISYSSSTGGCGGASAEDHCAARLDQAKIAETVKQLPARLGAVLDAIRAKAPKAIIVMVPYPRVIPPAAERCSADGLANDDADYFAGMGKQLEDAMVNAARAKSARVADAYVLSAGHGPCADADQRWVNGAVPAGSGAAFHPTAKGHEEMATLVLTALGG
ncbi:MAG TPA: SGNH/GDSL hydrolase family protein [Candidatus Acidoferrum sp.]|nr:SGNH/GDSL hydrolase family protein [Candidatus Acidoferrum sp.]